MNEANLGGREYSPTPGIRQRGEVAGVGRLARPVNGCHDRGAHEPIKRNKWASLGLQVVGFEMNTVEKERDCRDDRRILNRAQIPKCLRLAEEAIPIEYLGRSCIGQPASEAEYLAGCLPKLVNDSTSTD